MSCYVCRQVIRGYDHFNQAPPYNQPKDPKKCQLWDSVEQRHADEVGLPHFISNRILSKVSRLQQQRGERRKKLSALTLKSLKQISRLTYLLHLRNLYATTLPTTTTTIIIPYKSPTAWDWPRPSVRLSKTTSVTANLWLSYHGDVLT